LLEELQEESIILNSNKDLPKDIEKTLKEFQAEKITKKELSVVLSKKHSLNELFAHLNSLNIEILSFRNKANRLEQLFIHLTQ
jgi:ABC-2 type transport system ATP-binding protein|tara:strand:+ start:167 stop:415 length:249 start_codon:yes stop_codon:yes gene_type:complete